MCSVFDKDSGQLVRLVTFHLLVKDRRYFRFNEAVDTFDATFIGIVVCEVFWTSFWEKQLLLPLKSYSRSTSSCNCSASFKFIDTNLMQKMIRSLFAAPLLTKNPSLFVARIANERVFGRLENQNDRDHGAGSCCGVWKLARGKQ